MTDNTDHARIAALQQQVAELQQTLTESEEQFRSLTEFLPVGMYLNDVDGTAKYINKKCAELVGVPAEKSLNFDWIEYLHPDDRERVFSEWERSFTAGTGFWLEYRYVHADGAVVWVLGEIVPIKDDKGKVTQFIGTLTDITAQKEAELEQERLRQQLTEAQRMESIGRLAGGVAHDFNNMLQVILGNTQLAMEEGNVDARLHRHLTGIAEAAERSSEITRQLLSFARKEVVAPEVVDVNQSVANMMKLLERVISENIELSWRSQNEQILVRIDDSQLNQILMNLCINARDAIDGIGKITIETGTESIDEAFCATHVDAQPGAYAFVSIRDSGAGIEKSELENIFEPFYSTKEEGKGTGLGLAIVYGVVKQNGGFIDFQSDVGVGSLFQVYLPIHPGPLIKDKAAGETAPPVGRGEMILVVEDEAAILRIVQSVLEARGFSVLTANSLAEVRAQAEKHKNEIRLLITDVVMPEINGRDLAHELRLRIPELRCIYMSGYTDDVITSQIVAKEDAGFLSKPFSIDSLVATVQGALAED